MRYIATVMKIDPNIEEKVTLLIEGIEVLGFASVCPYAIREGNQYPVRIGFTVLDEFEVKEIHDNSKAVLTLAQGFSSIIRGVLGEDGTIDAGIRIKDSILEDYSNLIGKNVEFRVDRISIEFLKNTI